MAIISFSRNFIFVKTVKTAGTSIEVHLSAHCGPQDIVTPIFPQAAGHHPQNHEAPDGTPHFYNHQTLTEITARIPLEFSAGAFKFCFERHPVDKCISHFSMFKNSELHAGMRSFDSWADYVEQARFPVDHPRYMDAEGLLLVDKIYPYEVLQPSLDEIAQRCGFATRPLIAKEKTGWREDILPTRAERERIMSAFSTTNALLGYS